MLRINLEHWAEYSVEISSDGFALGDRYGRSLTRDTLGNVIWRKPVSSVPRSEGERWYGFQQFTALITAVVSDIRRSAPQKLLIDPLSDRLVDKVHQLRMARSRFRCAEWRITTHPSSHRWAEGAWVTKALVQVPIPGTGNPASVLFTTCVVPTELADGWPWLIQRAVLAEYDLTVVFVDGTCFCYRLRRETFQGLDWREHLELPEVQQGWEPVAAPEAFLRMVAGLMADLALRFGRLDFLLDGEDFASAVFLEVNPNGQWAWLDLDRSNGLMSAMMAFYDA